MDWDDEHYRLHREANLRREAEERLKRIYGPYHKQQGISVDIETPRYSQVGIDFGKEEVKTMSPKAFKLNKFYCAAEHIGRSVSLQQNDAWTRETEAEAIEHARTMLERDLTKDTVVIVKMVAVVRRQKPPVKITRLK